MSDKKNPLIMFHPRAQDNGKTIGGGSKEDKTKWLLKGAELLERSKHLTLNIDQIKADWDRTSIEGLPHVLRINLIEKALANTHQSQIVPMFTVGQNTGQIGFIGEHSLLMKVDTKEKLKIIRDNFTDIKNNAHSISALTEIELFKPQLNVSDKNSAYKLIPLTYDDHGEDKRALQVIQTGLASHDISYKLISYTKSIKAIRIPAVTNDSLKFIRTLPIRTVEPIAKVGLPFRFINGLSVDDFDLSSFDPKQKYPLIGLLDSGVATNKLTRGWVTRGKGGMYSAKELNTSHGTYIATLLIHGDRFERVEDSSINGCKIVDVPVIPKFGIEEDELIQNIEEAIEMNPEVKIWNLSVSLLG